MKLDAITYGHPLPDIPDIVRAVEADGYDAWLASETEYDPFLLTGAAVPATDRMDLGTGIVVAFARNPMTVAMQAHNLQAAMGQERRFICGLGSQVKPHIAKRFSMPWPERPAAAMRDFIGALHAIWDCWNDGTTLEFRSEHYTHRLMTPMFSPPPLTQAPAVWLAAVGPGMTRVAGEAADGILCHVFTTPAYMADTTLPNLQAGVDRIEGRGRTDIEVCLPLFVITGYDDDQRQATRQMVLAQIGFYGSTPAYRPVLAAHGWQDLGEELTRLSKADGWAEMSARIPEEVVDAFAIQAEPDELGDAIVERWGGIADRVSTVVDLQPEHLTAMRERLAQA